MVTIVNDFVKMEHIGVVQGFHDGDFSHHVLQSRGHTNAPASENSFVADFDGIEILVNEIHTELHLAVGARAKRFDESVLVDNLVALGVSPDGDLGRLAHFR